jgi:hypothetical protein
MGPASRQIGNAEVVCFSPIDGGKVRPVAGAGFPLADGLLAYRHKPARAIVVLRVGNAG